MVKKVAKWIGIFLGGLVALAIVAVLVLGLIGTSKVNATYAVKGESVQVPSDAASLARGEHLANNCRDCHGEDLGGQMMFEQPGFISIYSANLTTGEGGAANMDAAALDLAIRHGIDADGKSLIEMPAETFNGLSREDLGAIIAYLRSVKPVDHQPPASSIGFLGRAALAAGIAPATLLPASIVDHDRPFIEMPEISANADYGEYMVGLYSCRMCHGEDLSGGAVAFDPGVTAPNLTPAGELAGWSQEDFVQTLLTGMTPSGRKLNSEYMTALDEVFDPVTDQHMVDLEAIWLYLESLPPSG